MFCDQRRLRQSKMPKVAFEDVAFQLDLGEPPQELLEWAKENLGETEEEKSMKLYELREMIYEKGDVVAHRTDDAFLLRFLRARYFNVRTAYKLLVNYYTFKENNPELHENLNPLELRFIGDNDIIQVLPYREQTGRRVMIYKLGNWNPSDYPVTDLFKATLTLLELGILEQRAQILGGVCIFDFQGISISHAWQVTPGVAGKVIELMVTSFPLKVHALHIVFESWVFDIIYNMFKPLLSERMKDKIFFHGSDLESLHNHIDPKYLPKRYGGVRPNYRYNKWIEKFRTNPLIIKEILSLGYVVRQEDLDNTFEKGDQEEVTETESEFSSQEEEQD